MFLELIHIARWSSNLQICFMSHHHACFIILFHCMKIVDKAFHRRDLFMNIVCVFTNATVTPSHKAITYELHKEIFAKKEQDIDPITATYM